MNPTQITIPSYNSSTGAGTLSSIAAEHGVSVKDLLEANKGNSSAIPDPTNPNVIRAGATLNIPKAQVIQTTTNARADFQDKSAKLTDMATRLATSNQPATGTNLPANNNNANNNGGSNAPLSGNQDQNGNGNTVSIVKDIQNIDGTRTVQYSDGSVARVKATKNADGSESYQEIPSSGDDYMSGIKESVNEAKDYASKQIATIHSTLESVRSMTSAATSSLISGIQSMYADRIANVQDAYKRLSASRTEEGFRTGLTRYAPSQQEGILTETELEGNMKVAKLQGEMMTAIGKAQMAQSEYDLKSFNEEWNKIEAINKEMGSEIENLYKQAVDKQNADLKAQQQAMRESAQNNKQMLDMSSRAAPGLAASLSKFKSDSEKADFIATFAAKNGIDPNVLWGDVTKSLSDETKKGLDIQNLRSQIHDRAVRLKIATDKAGVDENGNTTDNTNSNNVDAGNGGGSTKPSSKAKFAISMDEKLAGQFEKVGLSSEDIVNLQTSLNNGNDVDTILSKTNLSSAQKKLIKDNVKAVK